MKEHGEHFWRFRPSSTAIHLRRVAALLMTLTDQKKAVAHFFNLLRSGTTHNA